MLRYYNQFIGGRFGTALLLLRFIVGLAFIFHGLPKLRDVSAFASAVGLPWMLAAVAGWTEVIGGALLILGLMTPLAASLIGVVMLVALFKVHLPAGHAFVNPQGASFELAAVYLCVMGALLLAGPGAYSMDARLVRQLMRTDEVEPVISSERRAA